MDQPAIGKNISAPRRRKGLDTLRGLTLVSMVAYHVCWDLAWMFGVELPWYHTAGAYLWQQSICWTFILLSGYCWSLGRRRLRRGLTVFFAGALVSGATALAVPENAVYFGVLTLLGTSALVLIPLERLLCRLPPRAGLVGSFTLFLLLRDVGEGFLGFEGMKLVRLPAALYRNVATAFLGFPPDWFSSVDYFPLLPWFFLFLSGYFLYRLRPGDCQTFDLCLPGVTAMGRHSLLLYLLHQPAIYGVLTLFDVLV